MPAEYSNITIETIDQAVVDWFDVTVDAHVLNPNNERKKVPVTFSAGERGVTSREKKAIRDKNGVLILPLININRVGIDPDPSMQALGIETPNLQISKQISGETNNLRNLDKLRSNQFVSSDAPVVYEITTMPFPDRSILNYQLKIQTQYISHMNEVLEKIFAQLNLQKSFVASFVPIKQPPHNQQFEDRKPIDSGYVCGFFKDTINDSGNLTEFTDQERIVQYQTSFRVPATLQLDPEGKVPAIQKEYTSYNVQFRDENVCVARTKEEYELMIKIFEGKLY